jgi:hypothetical protein
MNKLELIDLCRADSFSRKDIDDLDKLIAKYPWFTLPRFLKLKLANQLALEIDPLEMQKTVVFASNRKHLYQWIHGELDNQSLPHSTDIEFIEEEIDAEALFVPSDGTLDLNEDVFDILDEETESKSIPQKDDTEMEEPEIEDSQTMPIIESLESEDETEISADEETSQESISESKQEEDTGVRKVEMDLLLRNTITEENGNSANKAGGLIEQFLQKGPGVIKADKETALDGDVSVGSVQEDDSFITDTLAKIYVKQGLHAKAIYAYERLSLKYPEKSAYFAAQIEKIKNITNT